LDKGLVAEGRFPPADDTSPLAHDATSPLADDAADLCRRGSEIESFGGSTNKFAGDDGR
jgi:hypothetical protein